MTTDTVGHTSAVARPEAGSSSCQWITNRMAWMARVGGKTAGYSVRGVSGSVAAVTRTSGSLIGMGKRSVAAVRSPGKKLVEALCMPTTALAEPLHLPIGSRLRTRKRIRRLGKEITRLEQKMAPRLAAVAVSGAANPIEDAEVQVVLGEIRSREQEIKRLSKQLEDEAARRRILVLWRGARKEARRTPEAPAAMGSAFKALAREARTAVDSLRKLHPVSPAAATSAADTIPAPEVVRSEPAPAAAVPPPPTVAPSVAPPVVLPSAPVGIQSVRPVEAPLPVSAAPVEPILGATVSNRQTPSLTVPAEPKTEETVSRPTAVAVAAEVVRPSVAQPIVSPPAPEVVRAETVLPEAPKASFSPPVPSPPAVERAAAAPVEPPSPVSTPPSEPVRAAVLPVTPPPVAVSVEAAQEVAAPPPASPSVESVPVVLDIVGAAVDAPAVEALSVDQIIRQARFPMASERLAFESAAINSQSDDSAVREASVGRLKRMKNPAAAQVLLLLVASPDPAVRALALDALSEHETGQTVPEPFLNALADPSARVRIIALRGIYAIDAQKAIPYLCKALRDEDPGVRRRAVTCLAWVQAREAIPELIPMMLEDADVTVRKAVIDALETLKSELTVPRLIELLGDDDPQIRKHAYGSLRSLTGQGLIFSPQASSDARARGKAKWEAWWKTNKETFSVS